MKKYPVMMVAVLFAIPALAQFSGVPLAGGAAAPATGESVVSAGGTAGEDYHLYGARLSFAPIRRLALLADLGAVDPNGGDLGLGFQLGAQFTLPLGEENPVDVALRALWGRCSFDGRGGDVDANSFNGGVLVSRDLSLITPYAYLGVNFTDSETKGGEEGKRNDDSTDAALGFGGLLNVTGRLSFYLEFLYIDDPCWGVGARWRI